MTPTEFTTIVAQLGGPSATARRIIDLAGHGSFAALRGMISKRMHGHTEIGPVMAACVRALAQHGKEE